MSSMLTMLPLRQGGWSAHAVRRDVERCLRGAGQAVRENSLQGCPAALCSLHGSFWERWSIFHEQHAQRRGWGASPKDLPPPPAAEFLESRKKMLGAQQVVTRRGDDMRHADMLSGFGVNTTQGQCGAARLHIYMLSGGKARWGLS